MFRLLLIVLVVAVGVGGWYVHGHYTIDVRRNGDGGIESVKFVPLAGRGVEAADDSADVPPAPARATIRIATFDVDGLDENKLANHTVSDTLVRVLPHFDVIALQGIRSKSRGLLVHLVEQVNATGRSYDFATDAAALRDGPAQYNAVLFDRASVELDRSTVHFVGDPTGLFVTSRWWRRFASAGRSRPRPSPSRSSTCRPIRIAWPPRWTCWPPSSAPSATTAAMKTTSSSWATWRSITGISANWAACPISPRP